MVVAYHYLHHAPRTGAMPAALALPYDFVVLRFAVQVFFVISGFVIVASAGHRRSGDFLLARLFRLAPGIAICSLLTFAICRLFPDAAAAPTWRQFWGSFLTVPLYWNVGLVDVVYWSLCIELRFYALVAVALWLSKGTRHILEYCGAWLIVSLLLMLLPVTLPGVWRLGEVLGANFSAHFVLGVCLFRLRSADDDRRALTLAVGALALGLAAYQCDTDYQQVVELYGVPNPWWLGLGVSVAAFSLVALAAQLPVPQAWAAVAIRLGAISFPLYLLHYRLGIWFMDHSGRMVGADNLPFLRILSCASLAVAAAYLLSLLEPLVQRQLRAMVSALRSS